MTNDRKYCESIYPSNLVSVVEWKEEIENWSKSSKNILGHERTHLKKKRWKNC